MHYIYRLFILLFLLGLILVACNPKNEPTTATSYNARIGDKVWIDENADGIKQRPEVGFSNVRVNLYEDKNNDGKPDASAIDTSLTDVGGYYKFSGLNPNINYLVEVVAPNGYEFSDKHNSGAKTKDYDSDINPDTSLSDSIDLEKGRYFYWIDAALKPKKGSTKAASVGDKVWLDENVDGIKQTNEVGIGNIKINLWQGDTKPDRIIKSTITNQEGHYRFDNLDSSLNYFLEIITTDNYALSEQHSSDAPSKDWDSDFNFETGFSNRLDLKPDTFNYWLGDAALHEEIPDIEPPCGDDEICNF